MNGKLTAVTFLLCLFTLGITLSAYADGPYRGKVIDAETKEPIEGAVVYMEWNYRQFWEGSLYYDSQWTSTNNNGDFCFPGLWILNPWVLLTIEPSISISKYGYGVIYGTWNALIKVELGAPKGTYVLKIEKEKPTIMLKKRTSIKEEERYLWGGESLVYDVPYNKWELIQEEWKKEIEAKGSKWVNCDELQERNRKTKE